MKCIHCSKDQRFIGLSQNEGRVGEPFYNCDDCNILFYATTKQYRIFGWNKNKYYSEKKMLTFLKLKSFY